MCIRDRAEVDTLSPAQAAELKPMPQSWRGVLPCACLLYTSPHRAALMNSLGDALKAAEQHAKAEAIGQADMFGVLAEEPEQIEQSYASCQDVYKRQGSYPLGLW